jgi:hypothetical protein
MATVIGMFEHAQDVNNAINDLANAGFTKSQVGVVARHEVLKKAGIDVTTGTEVGGIAGATAGGIAGLLVGIGALLIPGLDIVAAGSFLVAIGATVIGVVGGGVAGGLVGALVGFGIGEASAEKYVQGVSRGHLLVTVQAEPDQVQTASDILRNNNAMEIDIGGVQVPGMPADYVAPQPTA